MLCFFHPRRPVAMIIGDIYGTKCNIRRICCLTTRSLTARLAIVANIKSATLGAVKMRPVVTDLTLDPTFAGSAASEWLAANKAWPLVVVFRSNDSEPCFVTVPDACRDEPTIHKQLSVLSNEHSHSFFIKPFHTCNASCNRSSDGERRIPAKALAQSTPARPLVASNGCAMFVRTIRSQAKRRKSIIVMQYMEDSISFTFLTSSASNSGENVVDLLPIVILPGCLTKPLMCLESAAEPRSHLK